MQSPIKKNYQQNQYQHKRTLKIKHARKFRGDKRASSIQTQKPDRIMILCGKVWNRNDKIQNMNVKQLTFNFLHVFLSLFSVCMEIYKLKHTWSEREMQNCIVTCTRSFRTNEISHANEWSKTTTIKRKKKWNWKKINIMSVYKCT